ncbi:MAG: hypothetical protein KAW92_10470 [Candidatus Cloacimonetes bacterium]|nr:hypothetical protein [Candidatus Cloacimonadota bacterium]
MKNYIMILCFITMIMFIGCSFPTNTSYNDHFYEQKAYVNDLDAWGNDAEVMVYGDVKSELPGIFLHAVVIGKTGLKVISDPFFVRSPDNWTPFSIIVYVGPNQIKWAENVYIEIEDMDGEVIYEGYSQMVDIDFY